MTRPLWTLAEIVAVSGGRLEMPHAGAPAGSPSTATAAGAPDGDTATAPGSSISGISIDTRTLVAGDLFVPLTDARDGHEFITTAFERGAAAALAGQNYVRKGGDGALIRVDDSLRALERIGAAARSRLSDKVRVIAVTGSAGKTGTKEMLRACLGVCASPQRVHAPEKSFNNHWGVPLTLARMPADTEFGVFEIGMNHAGEIGPLAKLVRPHIAIVTNVLPVHVGNFPDGEIGVANAKAEIFEGLKSNSAAILPSDSPHFERLRKAAEARGVRVISFGLDGKSDVHLAALSGGQSSGLQHVVVDSRHAGRAIGFDLGMLGQHLAINSLAVVAAVEALGCDAEQATKALASVTSAEGRGARALLRVTGGEVLLLDESYNSNPASMRAALEGLAATDHGGRRIAVLGDMLELGADSVRYHEGLKDIAERVDLVLCCGPLMRHLYDVLASDKKGPWAPSSADLIPHVLATLRPGDAVMVKGSLGSRMAPIVEAIRKRFSGD
jgi:UDP-N-acetylmuramoyl-tripeptide--D-alanyl-D-alanine ligase